ncbi:hypothetical protein NQ318_013882 [Aromia moschata]|uniref:Uncharacterized protein n=1 Tax=Aromia moschata TaxID=1265417 RepID=A0AAV8ZAK7_9CUCU|nr:hypothetical protein NQ318_013882 [Aromia moschata]
MMMLKVLLTYLSLQMTSVMLLAALSGLVVARPKSTTPVTILDQEYNMGDHLGEYDLLVQTSDGFVHSVKARLKNGDAKANEITVFRRVFLRWTRRNGI